MNNGHPYQKNQSESRIMIGERFVRWRTLSSLVIGGLVWVSASTHVITAADLRVERLFGPETRTGPYKHPARIEELKNGDLFMVYYGGEGEYATDTGVFGSRLKRGGRKWTGPILIAHDPFRS